MRRMKHLQTPLRVTKRKTEVLCFGFFVFEEGYFFLSIFSGSPCIIQPILIKSNIKHRIVLGSFLSGMIDIQRKKGIEECFTKVREEARIRKMRHRL